MNCKPGDLAVIVPPYQDKEMLGLVVTVVRRVPPAARIQAKNGDVSMGGAGIGWRCEGHAPSLPCGIADECLRPLRNPGDDAVDESLLWLPSPGKVTETA